MIEAAIAILAADGVAAFAFATAEQAGQEEFFAVGVVEFVAAGFGFELGENGRLAFLDLLPKIILDDAKFWDALDDPV